jgi:hypothetical protein
MERNLHHYRFELVNKEQPAQADARCTLVTPHPLLNYNFVEVPFWEHEVWRIRREFEPDILFKYRTNRRLLDMYATPPPVKKVWTKRYGKEGELIEQEEGVRMRHILYRWKRVNLPRIETVLPAKEQGEWKGAGKGVPVVDGKLSPDFELFRIPLWIENAITTGLYDVECALAPETEEAD